MAGKARNINRTPPDPRTKEHTFNLGSGFSAGNVNNSSINTIKNNQFLRSKGSVLAGIQGYLRQTISIASGVLDLTSDGTNDLTPRTIIKISSQTGATDTLDTIEWDGREIQGALITLIGTSGETITITHGSGVSGTLVTINCPGDTAATLSGDETMDLIYDSIADAWLIKSNTGDNLGNHIATQTLDMNAKEIDNWFRINGIDTGHQIASLTGIGLRFQAESAQTHEFEINSTPVLTLSGTTATFGSDIDLASTFDVLNFGTLRQGGTEADAGAIRLINNVGINWRDNGNSANLGIKLSTSDVIEVNTSMSVTGRMLMSETADPSSPTNSGYYYVKDVGGVSKPFYIGEGQAAVDLATVGTGANTALSNLASVAINTSLLSDSDGVDGLGDATHHWDDVFSETFTLRGSGGNTASTIYALYADDSQKRYIYHVPDSTGRFMWFIDGAGEMSFRVSTGLTLNNRGISNFGKITGVSGVTQYIESTASAWDFALPSGDAFRHIINSVVILTIDGAGNGLTFGDAVPMTFNTSTGTQIGTGTTQKLAFWNATPVVQPGHIADATDAASVITQLNLLLADMAELGLQAAS